MKIKLLQRIRRLVKRRVEQIDMSSWFEKQEGVPRCGTTACIAGWAITLAEVKKPNPLKGAKLVAPKFGEDYTYLTMLGANHNSRILPRGAKALGISRGQASRLFYTDEWPEKFQEELDCVAAGGEAYADVVARRIDHFIKTKGAE